MERRKWQTPLTKLHGDGDLLRIVCRQAFTVLVEALGIMAARRQERREREKVPRVMSPLKLRAVDETSMPVIPTPTVTWHETFLPHSATLPRRPAIRSKYKSERSVLLARLWYLCRSVAIPETVLTSLFLRHCKQVSSGLHTPPSQSLQSCSRVCPVLHLPSPIQTTLSTLHECNIHILVRLSRSQ